MDMRRSAAIRRRRSSNSLAMEIVVRFMLLPWHTRFRTSNFKPNSPTEAHLQLRGKTALITGGGRGIGRSIALAYAGEGADVAVVARTSTEIEAVAAEVRNLGRNGVAIVADLTDAQQVQSAVGTAIQMLGKLDILVNNAGGYRLFTKDLAHSVSFLELTQDEWDNVLSSNLTTAFLCCKAVMPHMVERGSGGVINMTSANVARRGVAGHFVGQRLS